MKLIFVVITFLLSHVADAQVIRQPLSTHYPNLGAYSKNFTDIFSATLNQASLANLPSAAFGVYGERRFMLNELSAYTAIIAVPASSGTFGFQADYFGASMYNESQLGFIYGRKITERINVGAKFNYHMIRIPGYSTIAAVNFEAGAIVQLTEKIYSGIHIYNPAGSRLGKTGFEKLASVYRVGLGYEVSEVLFIGAEIIKHEEQPVGVNAGIQYNLQTGVFIRCGISTGTNNGYAGVGLNIGFGRIDINAAYHPQLGFTPGVLLLLNFKKPGNE